jgi:polygalacturonase
MNQLTITVIIMMRSIVFSFLVFMSSIVSGQGGTWSVCDYGATGDGITLDTKAIQEAVDECNHSGGGTVYIPPGQYLSGTILLKSNVNLHLEKGVTLLGSTDPGDYYDSGHGRVGMIYCMDAENVGITGGETGPFFQMVTGSAWSRILLWGKYQIIETGQ